MPEVNEHKVTEASKIA